MRRRAARAGPRPCRTCCRSSPAGAHRPRRRRPSGMRRPRRLVPGCPRCARRPAAAAPAMRAAPLRAGACSFVRGRAALARGGGAQVALMFLTRGIIPYEDTWRQFLAAVPERVPGGSAAGWRALFSVYVHLPPDLAYPEGSLFAGHEIAGRIAVEWGQWSVVRAPRPDPPPPASRCRGHPPHASCISKCASAAAAAARSQRACARRPGTHMKTARRPRRSACCCARRWRTRATSALCWSARRASRCTPARLCGRSWRASRARACTPAATTATPRTPAAAWLSGAPPAPRGPPACAPPTPLRTPERGATACAPVAVVGRR
jgi:hypothetical protein